MQCRKATSLGARFPSVLKGRGEYSLRPITELLAFQPKPAKQATEGYSCHFKECGTLHSGFTYPSQSKVSASSPNQTGKGTTQHYSGIGQFVNYQTCTGLRQHGCWLLLIMEPETVDPSHRSMLCKDSNPLNNEVKDAYSIPFNQGRNIDNNDSCSMGKHESPQSIESTIHHFPELQPEDL